MKNSTALLIIKFNVQNSKFKVNELSESFKDSPPSDSSQQDALLPHSPGYHHWYRSRDYDACHRTGKQGEHQGEHRRDGFQHDHDFAGCRHERRRKTGCLIDGDYQTIKDECNYISAISPTVNSAGQWIYGNNNTQSSIYGVNQDYLSIRQLKVADGEMFTDADIKAAAKVCILGQTVVDYLFPDGSDPIGKVVRFNSIPFRVVGVLKKKGYNSMGMDQDDLVLAPYTTVMKRILAQTYLGGIVCSAITEEASQPAQDQISDILRRNHKLKDATATTEADEDDFNIRSQEEISSMMNSTMSTITILLGSVAGISLLVGGIGIMNIMYVSVTERTREIGLRMSVGARGIDILNQFLIEAILLSVTGGIIGVILGVSLSLSLNAFLHIATQIEPWSIIMSFAVCTFTGVFFGWYPAKKAKTKSFLVNTK